MKLSPRLIGTVQIIASGIGFGMLGIFGKWAYVSEITPGELLSFRFLIAAATLALGMAIFQPRALILGRMEFLLCAGLGILGYAVFSSCYFEALHGLSASLTVLLLYLYPVIVTVGAKVLFSEVLGRRSIIALPVVMVGLFLLLSNGIEVHQISSLAFGLGSAFFYAVYILVSSRVLKRVPPITAAFYVQLSAGVTLSAIHLRPSPRLLEVIKLAWLPVLGVAWVSTVLPITLFLYGLTSLSNSEASLLSTTEPLTAIIAASVLLHETLSPVQWAGGILVLVALAGLSLPSKRQVVAAASQSGSVSG